MRMLRKIIASSLLLIAFILLQSTLLHYVAIDGVIPNLYLIYLVYTSFFNGGLHGPSCGFLSGLAEDFICISPLGFHSLIKTIIGALYSSFKGLIILDRVFMSSMLVLFATVLNRFLAFGLLSFLPLSVPVFSIFSRYFFIEIVYNMLLTPPLFFLIDRIRSKISPREYHA